LARFLSCPREGVGIGPTSPPALQAEIIQCGDILLVEGTSRISEAIKYLTQSTWSHAALYVGEGQLIEADVSAGVRYLELGAYDTYHTRICRPIGLAASEIGAVIDYMTARVGHQYDMRHIVDLARYLVPQPPVPSRWRRRMLVLGSGDPTRAICSSLIAAAFHSVRYPILPHHTNGGESADEEILIRRHHTLFTPRDFDVSPYFAIVKPRICGRFDPHYLVWGRATDLLSK
jgi:hypothetical protein